MKNYNKLFECINQFQNKVTGRTEHVRRGCWVKRAFVAVPLFWSSIVSRPGSAGDCHEQQTDRPNGYAVSKRFSGSGGIAFSWVRSHNRYLLNFGAKSFTNSLLIYLLMYLFILLSKRIDPLPRSSVPTCLPSVVLIVCYN